MIHLLRLTVLIAIVTTALAGCKKSNPNTRPSPEPDAQVAENEQPPVDDYEGEGEIILIDEHDLEEFGIEIASAGPGVLRKTTSLAGEIVLNPDRVAHVVSRAGGIALEVHRTIGDRVEVGDTLAILESPQLAELKAEYLSRAATAALAATDLARAETIFANTIRLLDIVADDPDVDVLRAEISGLDIGASRSDLITAYAELQAAEAVHQREKALFERAISSESEYLSADSELKKTLAAFEAVRDDLAFTNQRELDVARRAKAVTDVSLEAAERRLHALGFDESQVTAVETESHTVLSRYEIRAPIAGRIIERHLVRGESLQGGEQIFVIADLSSVWGQLTLYQRDLALVREGQTASVLGAHDLASSQAVIEYVSPILDEQTRTTTARIVLDNPEGHWRPGMFIRANLLISENPVEVLIPQSAIMDINDETGVFVQTEEGIEHRDVHVGRAYANSVEILSGLLPGEQYVAKGGLAIKAEMNKAALEHAGHAH